MEISPNASFIPKLYAMVNDPSIPQIFWSKNGTFFVIPNPEEFASRILPVQFSHNNFASFVRQLNMYGFHKVADLSQLSDSGSTRAWAFEHAGFVKNRPDLLQNIHRKPKTSQKKLAAMAAAAAAATPATPVAAPSAPVSSSTPIPIPLPTSIPSKPQPSSVASEEQKKKAQLLIEELIKTKEQQQVIREQFAEIQRDRERLWAEFASSQQKLYEQQQVTKQVLNFLAAVFQQNPTYFTQLPQSTAQVQELTEIEAEELQKATQRRSLSSLPSSPLPSRPTSPSMDVDLDQTLFSPSSDDFPSFEHHSEVPDTNTTNMFGFDSPSEYGSVLHSQPANDEFLNTVLRFEDSNITPYCSMEEDRLAVNAPLNWVPS